MKKILLALGALAIIAVVSSCKEKRCECITYRTDYAPARSLEPLGNHKSCSELDAEWPSADTASQDLLKKECVEYMK